MRKYIFLISILTLAAAGSHAQSGIGRVLESVNANNKTLQAGNRLTEAQKLEARTGNNPANPTVEFNQLWGSGAAGSNVNELAVVQSFDFPSVYSSKNKLAKLKGEMYDQQYAASRQQILLAAQQTCQEIIYLRKQKELLDLRLKNALQLADLYKQKFENGNANQLELNKIQLEKINAQNESRLNEAALQSKSDQLQTLNGGIAIEFNDNSYDVPPVLPDFEKLQNEYLAADPTLKSLQKETETASREIKISKALTLPKIDLGYRRNGGNEEKLNGFVVGFSIPLWENKNTVKKAKVQAEYANAVVDDNTQNLKTTLQELYNQAQALQKSCKEYAQALSTQGNMGLLNEALSAGQISMIEYFVEITILNDSMQNYLTVEKEFHNTLARLLQFQL